MVGLVAFLIFAPSAFAGGGTSFATQPSAVPTQTIQNNSTDITTANQFESMSTNLASIEAQTKPHGVFGDLGHDIVWTLIAGILGGFIGLELVGFTDWLKQPVLYCEKGGETPRNKKHPTGDFKIIHIKVRNKDRRYKNLWLLWIKIGTASSTLAQITLKNKQKEESYAGKWTNNPQPILLGQVQPDMVYVPPRIDIYPSNGKDDESQEVAIGIKFEGEKEFYAFNMESYLYQSPDYPALRNPNLKFDIGEYEGILTLSSLGQKYRTTFKVHNPSKKLGDFHLEVIKA